jgi:two-component system, NarL family, nitrate/nitrite response regulator NarL
MSPQASRPIRVVVVDDHPTVLWGVRKLLESAEPRMEVADCAACGRDAIAATKFHQPDVVLLDLELGDESGYELISTLGEDAHVIILTGSKDEAARERAMLQGARGVVHKSAPGNVLLKAITCVHAGEPWLDRGTLGKLLNAMLPHRRLDEPAATLTPAEQKVVSAVVRHRSAPNKVIAATLSISEHTLRNHLSTIYSKLDIHRRVDLVMYAVERKLGNLGNLPS